MRVSLIIAAGGSGRRFLKGVRKTSGRALPKHLSKLFFPYGGKPLLAHTVAAFRGIPGISEILVACPREAISEVRKMLRGDKKRVPVKIVAGGKTRALSVLNALWRSNPSNPWVMVHDGARPFVTPEMVRRLYAAARHADGAILVSPIVPTVKAVDKNRLIEKTLDRSVLFGAETPQLVRRSCLWKAYRIHPGAKDATDEASLLEYLGGKVKVVLHDGWNPKITTFQDYRLALASVKPQDSGIRVGFGRDTHRLVPRRKLYLGGIEIPFERGALGHSDGDALLHALCDAILGVLGLGDIGDWFSDRDPRYKNIRSTKLLKTILDEAGRRRWRLEHTDSVITLERPKLGPYKQKIAGHLARLTGLPASEVSVKAKTMEGLGPEGEGLAVTCETVVTMRRNLP